MRKIFFIFFILLLFLSCNKPEEKTAFQNKINIDSLCLVLSTTVKSGDVIMKNGYGSISDLITKVLNEEKKISHCGIITLDSNKSVVIIHSVAKEISGTDGVQQIGLKDFLKDTKPNSLYILRYRGDLNEKIQKEAEKHLSFKIPFDHNYDLSTHDKLYCSELVYKIFIDVYSETIFETKPYGNTNLLLFNSIFKNKKFEIIKNL